MMGFSTPVLVFARYADVLGSGTVTVELPSDATAGDVLSAVRALPGADQLPPSPLIAVNQRYAALSQPVRPGDEVALIPPVAGG
ncbi:MAG TPA: MoaD/ThiS family protein [Gemmatimonadaceae bacterium]|nr:MoaD/ThiS family protein [Gemmatimonadaceae bacterium]